MIKIRKGVFETNSSSVHTITLCTKELYDAWVSGKALYNQYNEEIEPITISEKDIEKAREVYLVEQKNKLWLKPWEELNPNARKAFATTVVVQNKVNEGYQYQSYEDFGVNFERYYEEMTTPKGEKIVAFGYYGHD